MNTLTQRNMPVNSDDAFLALRNHEFVTIGAAGAILRSVDFKMSDFIAARPECFAINIRCSDLLAFIMDA